MEGKACFIAKLLEGTKTRFVIPVYQRNYDWKREECRQLFNDLEAVMERIEERGLNNGHCSHFFGSVVSKNDNDARVVIDGQQRITSCNLLLMALMHQCEAGSVVQEDPSTADRIRESYLTDKWSKGESKLKLKLIKADQAAFEALLKNDPRKFIPTSSVTDNYNYFRERIAACKHSAEVILQAVEDLQVIDIQLETTDDAQLIFESLNSTGLALSEGDKIRNFLLMNLDRETQDAYYEDYWNEIEKATAFDVDTFVRYYLAAVNRKTPPMKRVYPDYKDFVAKKGFSSLDQLQSLKRFSEFYRRFLHAEGQTEAISAILGRLALSDNNVLTPFVLNLFDFAADGNISNDEVAEVLRILETYLFRRWAAQVPTNALNKVFETLHNEIIKTRKADSSYTEVLKFILLNKEGSARFPRDAEFLRSLTERDFYPTQMKFYLFDRLENEDSLERIDVVNNMRDNKFTVEHIMPQTLSAQWKEDLGPEWQAVYDKWINKLANLTLTAYNPHYSNSRFSEKRDMEKGFKDSGFRMNRFVGECDKWGEEELIRRTEFLKDKFRTLWPMISTDFVPEKEPLEEHTLAEEEFEFTGRKIAAYTFGGARYTVRTWGDMLCQVAKAIAEQDSAGFNAKALDCSSWFHAGHVENYFQVTDSVCLCCESSTITKIWVLRRLFKALNINQDDLTFELYKTAPRATDTTA